MSRFLEYVNSKNKLAKPVVDPTGDQIDPKSSPVKPPKAKNTYDHGSSYSGEIVSFHKDLCEEHI